MRTFLRAHWKALVAIVLLVLLAMVTVDPGAATPELPLAARLRAHVSAIASSEHDSLRYIEQALKADGYAVRRQAYRAGRQTVRNIEVSIANVAPEARPARIFIVGAQDKDGGTAAVLELAHLLKDMRPSQGTEVKFVFFDKRGGHAPDAGRPDAGRPDATNFIAFVGTLAASRLVQDALSAFRPVSDFPGHGLAAPAYVQGLTLLNHSSYGRSGYPAIMVTDTGFMRYPYYKMAAKDAADDTPDQFDYDGTARVVNGLARTIVALAAGAQG